MGIVAAFLLVPLAGCATRRAPRTAPTSREQITERTREVEALAAGAVLPGEAEGAAQRLLVRRAAMGLDVTDVPQSAARTQAMAIGAGGFVEMDQRSDRWAQLMLRVPEPRLDGLLDAIGQLGRVTTRSASSEDVTARAIDVEARLRTLEASRDRLRELLARASALGDVLTVERELARVQAEIESLQGQLTHLRSVAAMAELQVSFQKHRELGPLGKLFAGIGRAIESLFVRG
jgi:hypothetical protein